MCEYNLCFIKNAGNLHLQLKFAIFVVNLIKKIFLFIRWIVYNNDKVKCIMVGNWRRLVVLCENQAVGPSDEFKSSILTDYGAGEAEEEEFWCAW